MPRQFSFRRGRQSCQRHQQLNSESSYSVTLGERRISVQWPKGLGGFELTSYGGAR